MLTAFALDPVLAQDTVFIQDLPLCSCLLSLDSLYPWLILVPRVAGASEVYQLTVEQQQQLCQESSAVAALLAATFNADKMNVAALGNVVRQLHVHHVVRYHGDAAWPKPVWGQLPAVPYSAAALQAMVGKMQAMLAPLQQLHNL